MSAYLKEVTTVTLDEQDDGKWELQVWGLDDSMTVRARFSATCASMDEALETLADWRKGVIIV